jgi:hypothetical protein
MAALERSRKSFLQLRGLYVATVRGLQTYNELPATTQRAVFTLPHPTAVHHLQLPLRTRTHTGTQTHTRADPSLRLNSTTRQKMTS